MRVFIYEAERPWLLGNVQPLRVARLSLPADFRARSAQPVYLAAVPVGARGRDGDPATGGAIRSDIELADQVASFQWTLIGHTLSAAPIPRRRR